MFNHRHTALPPITRRDLAIGVLIVLLAYFLRVVVVFDRAAHDTGFDPLPLGSDQQHYLLFATQWEQGTWPNEPFWYQPGLVYTIVAIRALVGESLGNLRLVLSLVGALTCGLMVGVGWLLTRRKWGGYLAGLLLAVYPVALFFATEPLDTVMSTFYVALFLFLALWQREKVTLWRSAALGLTLGLAVISRTNLALLGLAWLVWLALILPNWRVLIAHALISLVALTLPLAPVTLYNRQQGSSQLITRVGMEEVYRGSNRDATGTYVSSRPAFTVVADGRYTQALLDDIQRDPHRFIDLQIRKFSLFWSALEPGNNIDYNASGEAVSPLLRAIPLDFRILALVGVLGLIALFYDDWRSGVFLGALMLLLMAGVLVIWVEARLRVPIAVPLTTASAYLGVTLADQLRSRRITALTRRLAVAAVLLVALGAYFDWAVDALPVQRPVAALPADAQPLNVIFDDKLELVGWRPGSSWPASAQGWSEARQSYVVELYWRVLEPVSRDYNAYVAYANGDQRLAGRDTVIGAISYQSHPTSTWQPGEIYREILGFKLPNGLPTEISDDIRVGVYLTEGEFTPEQDNRVVTDVPITSLPDQPGYITLQRLALVDLIPPRQPTRLTPASWIFDDQIVLRGYQVAATASGLELTLDWEAIAEVSADYTVFVHIEDDAHNLIAQFNGQPRSGAFVTSTWPLHYPILDTVVLDVPPGDYNVYIGLYDSLTHERLPVDARDNRPLLEQVTLH